jgi:diketogulonate reductase-like aldo/keto reductase
MQLDAIDLLQFHAWNYADPNWLDCLFWLQELKEEGFIRNIGLTNFDTAHLRIALTSGIDVVSNQVCYSLIDQRASGRMADLCKEFSLKILAFGTLAGGFLSEKWVGHAEPSTGGLSTWSEMKYKRFIDVTGGWKKFQPLLRALQEIAKKHAVSISNIAMKYILEKPSVGGVIIGARLGKKNYIKENLKVFEIELDEADKKVIHEIQSQFDPVHGDCGDEYRKAPILTATGDLTHHLDVSATPFTPIKMSAGRVRVNSGTVWEDFTGYSRAIRKGNHIAVSGTTASHGERLIGGSDPAAQAHFVIDKIQGAIESLGGYLEDVVRTRIYVNNIKDWEAIAQVHGERFGDIQPANTLVEARLVGTEYLMEMEVDAIIDSKE